MGAMRFRLVDGAWDRELENALQAGQGEIGIVCPFIKKGALERLLKNYRTGLIKVITRFDLRDCAEGVSDLSAMRLLLERGAQVRGVRNLHAKLYLFGTQRAVVTSANLTEAAMVRNHELGFIADDTAIVTRCRQYFDNLWGRAGKDLTTQRLAGWEEKLTHHLASGAKPGRPSGLTDEGTDAGAKADNWIPSEWIASAEQAFVKFLGEAKNRVPLTFSTLEEIQRSGCHWAVAYPNKKRPTGVSDGALMFIGRLTKGPDDIRVFGRAIGMRYEPGRDDATAADIALRPWKKIWPRYVRVHHAEFLSGSMTNGISLNELMETLKADAFAATQRNTAKGAGNTNPRSAYSQQAAVKLSQDGQAWLNQRLESAFRLHGKLAPAKMATLDWPEVPRSGTKNSG